ncbi:hypothetical protein [Rhodopirellula bahusiensis]|uniref:hypothetical protein n=1 Tax=Rhodopirellula bahusiensis TaxID=2014065 RepID=UPI0032675F8C
MRWLPTGLVTLSLASDEVAWVSGATRVLKLKGTQGTQDATEDQAFSDARTPHLHR